MLSHKESKFRIQAIQSNNRKIPVNFPNIWKLNSTLLNNPWMKE